MEHYPNSVLLLTAHKSEIVEQYVVLNEGPSLLVLFQAQSHNSKYQWVRTRQYYRPVRYVGLVE